MTRIDVNWIEGALLRPGYKSHLATSSGFSLRRAQAYPMGTIIQFPDGREVVRSKEINGFWGDELCRAVMAGAVIHIPLEPGEQGGR